LVVAWEGEEEERFLTAQADRLQEQSGKKNASASSVRNDMVGGPVERDAARGRTERSGRG